MLKRRYTVSDEDEGVKQDKLKIQKHEEGVNIDDEVMKVRLVDWMECDKTYPSEEEKARRYKVFKENAMAADKANGSFTNGAHLAPNNLGDWTKGELYRLRSRQGNFPSESYFRRTSKMYAEGRVDGVPGIVDAHDEVECTEAVKHVHILNYPKRRCSLNRNVHNHFFFYGMFRVLAIRLISSFLVSDLDW